MPWEDVVGYSRAVVAGPWVLVSGSTAVSEGKVQHTGDAYAQARMALDNALWALGEAGVTKDDVVRTRMYVTDMVHATDVGRAHFEVFGEVRPATSMVAVKSLIDPEMLVEIEVTAYSGPG